jgi:hypothetical protein
MTVKKDSPGRDPAPIAAAAFKPNISISTILF